MHERGKRVQDLLLQAVEIKDSEKRGAFLDAACRGNVELRRELEELLKAHSAASGFFPGVPSELVWGSETPMPGSVRLERAGDRIGRYKLLQNIGEGGCGVVYMAEQEEPVRRKVALKVIKLGMDTKSVVARFEAERQALALMDHPHIARVLDAGATETGRPYFVMELVRGTKITDYCDENGLSTRQRLELFIQVCQAVQHAHQKGIIHRDLKPSNILITVNGDVPEPKVIDFGIAKATGGRLTDQTLFTAFEQFLGTPDYMSPEQAAMTSLDIDTRSDIYSLGVLLYELLTGNTLFDTKALLASGLDELRRTIREKEPVPPSTLVSTMLEPERSTTAKRRQTQAPKLIHLLRGDLDWIVMKCLEKDRRRRYETANGLSRDIERHLSNEPVVARPPSRVYRLQKLVRRNKLAFSAGAIVFIALLAGFLVSTSQYIQKSQAYRLLVTAENESQQAHDEQIRLRQQAEAKAYVADMGLALQAWEEGNMQRAQELLSAYLPAPGGRDLRGFEWRYLSKLCRDESSCSLTNLSRDIRSLALSPSGELLVAGGRETVRLIEVGATREVGQLPEQMDWANSVAFLPGSENLLATAGGGGMIEFWSIATKKVIARLNGYPDGISCISFSPDGKKLAVAGWGTTLQLWDVERSTNLWTANTLFPIQSVLFTRDGTTLISGGGQVGNPLMWQVSTGKQLPPLPMAHRGFVVSLALSPDGRTLATGSIDSRVVVWDLPTRRPMVTLIGHFGPVLSLDFAPDGGRIASGGTDNTVRVWDVTSGKQIVVLRGHQGPVNAVLFGRNGTSIFSASEDRCVKFWDLNSKPNIRDLRPRGTYFKALALAPGDRFLAAVDYAESTARLWDVLSGQAMTNLSDCPKSPASASFSPDGEILAVGGNDHTVSLWHVATCSLFGLLTNDFPAGSLAFSADGKILAVGGSTLNPRKSDIGLALWDIESRKRLNRLEKAGTNVTVVAFGGRGRLIAVGQLWGTVEVWDFEQQRLTAQFKCQHEIAGLAFSSDDSQLASAGEDGSVVIYNLASRSTIQLKGHTATVSCVAFSPDDKTLASGSADGTIKLWNVATHEVTLTLKGHVGPVASLAFSHKGELLASCGADGEIRLWCADTFPK